MSKPGKRAAGLALVAFGALALGHCGGGSGAGPTDPPVPPVTTPTPAPTPTAEPPISASCAKLPPGSVGGRCNTEASEYQDIVDRAIRTLQGEQPAIFEGDQVLSIGAYYVGLIKILDRQGLCAATDGEELGVTDRASSNEQFDVLSAQSRARFGPVSYRVTCSPSAVPIPLGGMIAPPAGCTLPSSREIACGREPHGRYHDDVEAAIAQLQKDKPELFDFNDTAQGTSWPALKNVDAYVQGVIDILAKKGYCARNDGEELAIKHGSNTFSEQYDIDFQHKYIRTGAGIYRLSCYPAAF
jgi:hypothetical protein